MLVGLPQEIKSQEYRTSKFSASVQEMMVYELKLLVDTLTGAGI
jgi:alanine dehydrogenase